MVLQQAGAYTMVDYVAINKMVTIWGTGLTDQCGIMNVLGSTWDLIKRSSSWLIVSGARTQKWTRTNLRWSKEDGLDMFVISYFRQSCMTARMENLTWCSIIHWRGDNWSHTSLVHGFHQCAHPNNNANKTPSLLLIPFTIWSQRVHQRKLSAHTCCLMD